MSTSSSSACISVISIVLLLLCASFVHAQDTTALPVRPAVPATQADSTKTKDSLAKKVQYGRQLTLGVDVILPVRNYFETSRQGFEFQADYYTHNEMYLAAEVGWGSSEVAYPDLKYTTSNKFIRLGFNKVLLPRESPTDWGGLILGLRMAAAAINRSNVSYTVIDSLWGNAGGSLGGKSFGGYWFEINAGVRLELYKGIMAGWLIHGKFLLNSSKFRDLAPLYVAGYGRGDKNAVFDFNFYLSYAVRWKRGV